MSCQPAEVAFQATMVLGLLLSAVSAWLVSSLTKILQLRHSSTFALLGSPNPIVHGESSRIGAALVYFVWSGQYLQLRDAEVSHLSRRLRVVSAVGTLAFVFGAGLVIGSSHPSAVLSLACWRVG